MATLRTNPQRPGGAAAAIGLALLALSGCATIRQQQAADREQLLIAAGFQRREASNPAQHQDLTTMPPYKIVQRSRDGSVVYTFADPEHCHCLYVGGPNEFAEYQRLLVEREAAHDVSDGSLDWAGWGVWWR
jgi:hypothetical protein